MSSGRLAVRNHRGVLVPRTLGFALAAGALASTLVVAALSDVGAAGWGALVASLLAFGAGLVDDLAPPGPRGVRAHLRALGAGRMTTGILKVVVIVGAALVAVALQPRRATGLELLGAVLVAATANVANGLDVRPGRALKAFLLPAALVVAFGQVALAPELPGVLVAALLVLPLDLRERAMLGDAGANLLGFAVGLGLYAALPDPWVVPGAAIAVGLNALGETVSFSRAIEATPPLRWLDGLGRLPG